MHTPTLLITAALACAPALAQVHAGDMILSVDPANKIVVHGTDDIGAIVPNRVFADRFGKLGPSLPNRTPDPGVNAIGGQFPSGQVVGLRITRAARLWTPSLTTPGEGEFCLIPDEQIEIRKSGNTIVSPLADPADPATGPSIELGITDSIDGQFHEHGVYWLTTPFDAGIYLLEVAVWANGATPSDPVWLVFNQNRPQDEIDDAVTWLLANVAGAGGSLCPPITPTCPCDWNAGGGLSVQDIFDFLSGYFTGNGDFNNSGATTVQDIFDFLSCYFNGC